MDIEIPAIPGGIMVLLGFFSPYAVAIINHPRWNSASKKVASIFVSIVLAGIVMALYYLMTGDLLPSWPVFILLALVVMQTSYSMILKPSATSLEGRVGPRG